MFAGFWQHFVVLLDCCAADVPLDWIDVEVSKDFRLVEEVVNAQQVFTGGEGTQTTVVLQVGGQVGHVLVVAGLVDVVDDGQSLAEVAIDFGHDIFAALGAVSEGAGASEHEVVLVDDVVMFVEELVLINGHAILRLVAFPGVGAAIAYHYSLQLDLSLSVRQLVHVKDLLGQIWNVDAGVALSRNEEIVAFEVWEFPEEINEGVIVVLCDRVVVIRVVPKAFAEADLSR